MTGMTPPRAGFDASRPHTARVYDYLLGGKDNFAADRAVGDQIIESIPAVQLGVRAQRDVLARVVRYLVGEAGLRQLLDIGSGLPTAENVHQTAQRLNPAARVVYLDNDAVVMSHARALLADDLGTFAVYGDLRDPAAILTNPEVRKFLDWDQPIGLLMCGILHQILDEDGPAHVTSVLFDALPTGSYVFIHHMLATGDPASAELQDAIAKGLDMSSSGPWTRSGSFSATWRWSTLDWSSPGMAARPGDSVHPRPPGTRAGLRRSPHAKLMGR